MRISAINTVQNQVKFGTQKANDEKSATNPIYKNEKLLQAGLKGLAVVGIATVGYAVLKKQGKSPVKLVKNSFKKAKDFLSEKPQPDPITQKLGGRRDAEAVKLYKGYVAVEKMNSLHNKLLSGYFDGKPQAVFDALRKNEMKLKREARIVL